MLLIALMLNNLYIRFPSIPSMINMVEIGRSKFGQNNRISLVEGLPEILNLEIGDYVVFSVMDGRLILSKDTKTYYGLDFEGDEIRENLRALEESMIEKEIDRHMDPEELEKIAREEYERDMEIRNRNKKKR